MGMLHIKLKGITECSNMVAHILPKDTFPDPGDEVNRSNSTFSEHGHAEHQIKEKR